MSKQGLTKTVQQSVCANNKNVSFVSWTHLYNTQPYKWQKNPDSLTEVHNSINFNMFPHLNLTCFLAQLFLDKRRSHSSSLSTLATLYLEAALHKCFSPTFATIWCRLAWLNGAHLLFAGNRWVVLRGLWTLMGRTWTWSAQDFETWATALFSHTKLYYYTWGDIVLTYIHSPEVNLSHSFSKPYPCHNSSTQTKSNS